MESCGKHSDSAAPAYVTTHCIILGKSFSISELILYSLKTRKGDKLVVKYLSSLVFPLI